MYQYVQKYREQVRALPNLGLGLGLRHVHFDHILEQQPKVDWFELISENFMFSEGRQRAILRQLAERYPMVMHGVSLSIGSMDPLNMDYLRKLKELAEEIQPRWISDHLCWTGILGTNTHDLLPLPLTEEALAHVIERVNCVQEFLNRPLVLENPSTYLSFTHSSIPEPEFLRGITEATGCGLLLDVNNCYVTCYNAGTDPLVYLNEFPMESVVQMHLAGHQHCGTHIIDTHDRPVTDAVWELFRQAWQSTGGTSILLEWDGNIPSFERCMEELHKSRRFMDQQGITAKASHAEITSETVATPIDFLVPDLLSQTRID